MIVTEMGRELNEVTVIERAGKEWVVLLLGSYGEMSTRMIDAVKEFLEKMWYSRSRN